jgi:malonyl-CoA/methylmalonyl-CoA synthetase
LPSPAPRSTARGHHGRAQGQLANFKIPKRCFVVPELPRNTMGKVQKNLLRDDREAVFIERVMPAAPRLSPS